MENQEKLTLLDNVQEIIALAYEYQNKGIGTANIRFNGHVSNIDIDLHHGGWKAGYSAEKNLSFCIGENDGGLERSNEVIAELKYIIENAPTREEAERIRKEKELSDKKQQLEKLAKELNVKIIE